MRPHLFHMCLRRKLRLALFIEPLPKCKGCSATIDAFGDHICTCPKYAFPRDVIHDAFRDSSYCVMDCLASRAGFVHNADEVLHEPENLISEQPRLRPGDTVLSHESAPNSTFRYTPLIDYSTAVSPVDPSRPLVGPVVAPHPTTEQVTQLHEAAENKKLHGPNRQATRYPVTGERLIFALNNRAMLLRPFTIDQYGQFGPLAYTTLYGKPGPHQLHDASERLQTGLGHNPAKFMLTQNYHPAAPSGLLPKADKQWKAELADQGKHHSTHWFTGSYHAQLPSQWAEQVIGFNITRALSQYFYNAVRVLRVLDSTVSAPNQPDPVPGYSKCSSLSPRSRSRLHTPSSNGHLYM